MSEQDELAKKLLTVVTNHEPKLIMTALAIAVATVLEQSWGEEQHDEVMAVFYHQLVRMMAALQLVRGEDDERPARPS